MFISELPPWSFHLAVFTGQNLLPLIISLPLEAPRSTSTTQLQEDLLSSNVYELFPKILFPLHIHRQGRLGLLRCFSSPGLTKSIHIQDVNRDCNPNCLLAQSWVKNLITGKIACSFLAVWLVGTSFSSFLSAFLSIHQSTVSIHQPLYKNMCYIEKSIDKHKMID